MIQLRLLVLAEKYNSFSPKIWKISSIDRLYSKWSFVHKRLFRWYRGLLSFFGKCKFEKESKSKRNWTSKNESNRSFTDHFEADLVRYSEIWLGKHRRLWEEWWRLIRYQFFECTGLELQFHLLFYSVACNQFSKMRLNSPLIASCWEFMKSCLIFKLFQISQIELFPTSSFSIFTFQLPTCNSKSSWILQWSNVFEESTFLELFTHEHSQSFEGNWLKTSLGHSK